MFSKWRIKGIDGYLFGEDKNLYRIPFKSGRNSFGIRLIKKQYPSRYRINNEWWSERQLKDKIYLDPEPVRLFESNDIPF